MKACPARRSSWLPADKLENYLIGREPVRDFPESNGHGRAAVAGPARPAIGVLKITAANGVSDDELNRKLLDMAKDRGLKSVYYVETMGGDLTPRLLYRVDARRQARTGAWRRARRPRPACAALQCGSRRQGTVGGQLHGRRAGDGAGAGSAARTM